ncbi:uronyl 2-sulfotransferase-like [Glandiceps talaboti]
MSWTLSKLETHRTLFAMICVATVVVITQTVLNGSKTDNLMWKTQATCVNEENGESRQNGQTRQVNSDPVVTGVTDDVDPQLLVYNRMPKCGSRSLIWIMRKIADKNNITYEHSEELNTFVMSEEDQAAEVHKIASLPRPAIFDMHVRFLDFTKFGEMKPLYINLIRDPVEHHISAYYYVRFGDSQAPQLGAKFKGTEEDRQRPYQQCVLLNKQECQLRNAFRIIPFFCGHDPECRWDIKLLLLKDTEDVPSQWSLEKAKRNVVKEYTFVGTLEEFKVSLKILEHLLPQYFEGATKFQEFIEKGEQHRLKMHTHNKSTAPSTEVIEIMRKRLDIEYEFYDFINARIQKLKQQFGIS